MRLTRLRLQLRPRTLLIAAVVAGMMLGGWQMWKRWEYCLKHARYWDAQRRSYREMADICEQAITLNRDAAEDFRRELARFVDDGADTSFVEQQIATAEARLRRWESQGATKLAKVQDATRFAAQFRRVACYPWLPLPLEPE